ncbi:MAG: hypothetical protein NDI68_01740 [Arenimonas sp.]|nr:hypothetical protein [Arenimonas sp.]
MRRRASPAPALLALALLLLAACTRPLPAAYADYAGHWRGEGVLLVIAPNGHADYERVREGMRTSIEGPVHGFSAEGFKIGLGPLSASFEVQVPPHLADGRWRMTVDGVELTRVEILPVEAERETLRL